MGALVLALARPSMTVAVPREEATIVLAIDVSRSMRATDVEPTRLAAAEEAASAFVDQLPAKFKVGLVVFSTEARTLVMPTTDRAEIHAALDALQADGGTALGDAISLSLRNAGLDPTDPRATDEPTPSASPDPSASSAPSASNEQTEDPV